MIEMKMNNPKTRKLEKLNNLCLNGNIAESLLKKIASIEKNQTPDVQSLIEETIKPTKKEKILGSIAFWTIPIFVSGSLYIQSQIENRRALKILKMFEKGELDELIAPYKN
ncbi:MAG: hypothetical protein NT039_04920 [Candidatus Berkelbacteria bacterium]|nr:hypothetical protein [Candidatus Berkelbacteria bacterium]